MKKYLIIKNIIYGTYQTDTITSKELIDFKNGECEGIINTIDGTYFDVEKNQWIKIEDKKEL